MHVLAEDRKLAVDPCSSHQYIYFPLYFLAYFSSKSNWLKVFLAYLVRLSVTSNLPYFPKPPNLAKTNSSLSFNHFCNSVSVKAGSLSLNSLALFPVQSQAKKSLVILASRPLASRRTLPHFFRRSAVFIPSKRQL